MHLAAAEVGYFEDYEDEEALEVGIVGMDEVGVRRSFSFQRSSYDGPDEQDVETGMDSYNISTERGFTVYGGLQSVRLSGSLLSLELIAEDAQALDVESHIEVDLSDAHIDVATFSAKLRNILNWGSEQKRPEMIGLDAPPAE